MKKNQSVLYKFLLLAPFFVFLSFAHFAHATLTFNPTNISGDSSVSIDGLSTISIGTSTATGITIGNLSAITKIQGAFTTMGPTGLTIANSNTPEGSATTVSIYEATDTVSNLYNATYIVPSTPNRRLFFGTASDPLYALNFANVTTFENIPSLIFIKGNLIEWGSSSGSDSITTTDTPSWDISKNNVMTFQTYDTASSGDFIFRGSNTGNTWLTISGTNGNVGIGTTTPATKLDVNGDITDEKLKSAPCVGTNSTGTFISVSCGSSGGGGSLALEIPSGTVNGVNTVFTVGNAPLYMEVSGQVMVSLSQDPTNYGYTYSSGTVTFVNAPIQTPHSFHN
jgi:hypothetical protein